MNDMVRIRIDQIVFRILPLGSRMPTSIRELRDRIYKEIESEVWIAAQHDSLRRRIRELEGELTQREER